MGIRDSISQAGMAAKAYADEQQNTRPATPGSAVPEVASTPAAAPANDTTGAGGSGPDSPPQSGGPDWVSPGGMPTDKTDQMGIGQVEELEKSAANVANGKAPDGPALSDPDVSTAKIADQKVKLNESLDAWGANPEKALNQLKNDNLKRLKQLEKEGAIDKKTYTNLRDRWKNIFNVIPKEDFGMVLMDFGMRAMMAGETMGSAAALGAAGSGALQGVQARKEQDYQRGVEQEKLAGDMARADLSASTAALTASKKGSDTKDTQEGVMEWRDGKWEYMEKLNPETGKMERVMPSALAGRPPTDKWKIDRLVAGGMSPEKADRIILLGQDPQRAKEIAVSSWNAFERDADATITIGGKTYTKRDVKKADIADLKRAYMDETLSILGIPPEDRGPAQGGGALNQGGEPDAYEWLKDKPSHYTPEQWDEYVASRKEAVGW